MHILILAAQILLLFTAAWGDVVSRLIPNYLCVLLAIVGLVGRAMMGIDGLAISAALAVVVFIILAIMYSLRWLGGGDVKLLTALALGLSPNNLLIMIPVMALSGGLLAMLHLAMRRLPRPKLPSGSSLPRRVYAVERWRILRHAPLPYGVAIACGGIWALLSGTGV